MPTAVLLHTTKHYSHLLCCCGSEFLCSILSHRYCQACYCKEGHSFTHAGTASTVTLIILSTCYSYQRASCNVHCRPIAHHEVEKKQSALRYVRIETAIALACSFLINLFIVSVFAKVSKNFPSSCNHRDAHYKRLQARTHQAVVMESRVSHDSLSCNTCQSYTIQQLLLQSA